ncbi:hypothetical protein [Roseateles amylovorans]|uniref:Uncharacterized protein n=1 Tax=Roseateles amylovorans TaxID=2978473 RepID=A0ABY6B2U0_9BURK|nr:hypothetical protein [Roseateles amylovorans]UXH79708.1 hypothetical protein N4261_07300 [Roseateles amylovorans]
MDGGDCIVDLRFFLALKGGDLVQAMARGQPDRGRNFHRSKEIQMRSILLYMLGVPIPIIILIALFR